MAPLIELSGIRKRYPGGEQDVEVLHGIDLRIEAGEFVAIMGSSGSGKSTLMHILGCLDRASEGDYRFAGRDVGELDHQALAWLRREMFGFVFQSYHLISTASAWENVALPAIYAGLSRDQRRQRAQRLLTDLGLGDRLDHRPWQLSGGQQQRVSIARALMNGGRVILADEPTGALDSVSGEAVMTQLQALAEAGHTVIVITHDADVAAHADRVVELHDGRIVADTRRRPARRPGADAPDDLSPPEESRVPDAGEVGEAVTMALRSLRANWLRTLLTLLGIVIGVGAVVVMLAIGQGAKQDVVARIGDMGTNLLVIRPDRGQQRVADGVIATLVPADADALRELPNVRAAVPEIAGSVTARANGQDVTTSVKAVSEDYPVLRDWRPESGIFFSRVDQDRYAPVAVIGRTVREKLFGDGDALGQFILLDSIPFQVIGVMSAQGATNWGDDQDDVVFVPLSTGTLRLFGQNYLRSITLAVDDVAHIDATEQAAVELLTQRHGTEDVRVFNMASLLDMVSDTQNTLTMLLGSIAAISLLVGGIGVMNIMLVSVTERIHEIGIRMATGARQRNILQQFLTEAVVVSALGGVIGVALGVAVGLLLTLFGLPILFSVPVAVAAFLCAAVIGLVFGFAPALKAARLNPVEALSNE
ncbi:MacB family efflux pump subunit [Alcanivorax marinus]|uniref:Pyoverdine export ATP-binding/permease protein PvdT n=1 Tax=Alloalcanivorax marinus TaxID=1177169 RepID=A0A9Q3URJ1_9GAMM|nr:MacB family efflux pump subunit [Alloalcanivorax marinus]MCC4309733.1 MacB family efflux pump subunit [Alloalcanivorax marinus]MCU5787138.1 ABC transporter ATP-binding protein/permease [Alloalcanivorax marinus]